MEADMRKDDYFDRLMELRDDMREALNTSHGTDLPRDAMTRARLADVEQLIAEWVTARA
jgi:hypothetical protein